MIVTYENGQQIIEHESGHRDVYKKEDLEKVKAQREKRIAALNDHVINLNLQISEIENSIGV